MRAGRLVELERAGGAGAGRGLILGGDGDDVVVAAIVPGSSERPDAFPLDAERCPSWPAGWEEPAEIRIQDTRVVSGASAVPVGDAGEEVLSTVLRERLETDVTRFCAARHRTPPFDPSDPHVPYAGRVFDHHDLCLALDATLEFGLTLGHHSEHFARELAEYLGVHRSLFVNSGSSANLIALSALTSPLLGERALSEGDEVITTAGGFPTTLNPILQTGLSAVLVDNEVGTGNVEVERLADAVSSRTRAVLLAHTLGHPFDLTAVEDLCREHDLWLIEDNCDSLGARYDGRLTGSFGDLSTLSFYPGHHMTTGEGGAVNIRSLPLLARAAESFRDWGRDCWCQPGEDDACGKRFDFELGALPPGYDHKFMFSHVGYSLRPTEWQAAIGRAQLAKLDGFVAARNRNWRLLRDALDGVEDVLELPFAAPRAEPSWFGFKLMVREEAPFDRNDLVRHLEQRGIQTRMILGGNLMRQPAIRQFAQTQPDRVRAVGSLWGADRLMNDGCFVGVYPGLGEAHLDYVAEAVTGFVSAVKARRIGRPVA